MHAADETPHHQALITRRELRPASALARVGGVLKAVVRMQRRAVHHERSDDRDLNGRELRGKAMLLEQRARRPATGPVELDDDRFGVLDPDLVDAILVAVERQHAAVARKPQCLDRRDDAVRGQA